VTQDALVLLLAYTVVFLVTLQRIRAVEDVRRLLRWCALSAVLMAGFGLVQYLSGPYLSGNGKFFWCYQHPYSSASDVCKGSFANRNHFAHFLALGIGPLIWWIHDAFRRRRARSADRFGPSTKPPLDNPLLNNPLFDGELKIALLVLALAVVLFAGLLSLSRGGVVVMVLAGTISAVVCCRAASLRGRFIAGLAAAGVLIIASLAVFGHERVSTRMSDLSSGSLETLDRFQGRRTIWTAVAKAIPDFALLGSGVGSHREVYPMYLKVMDHPLEYTHAENGYMQVLLETGAAGLVLLLVGIGFCAFWCIAGLRMANRDGAFACVGAVAAGLAASAMHSVVDFVWYVPACTVMIAVLAACACRLWQTGGDGACWQTGGDRAWRIVTPRTINVAAAVAIAVVGVWMVHGRIGPMRAQPYWDEYGITAGALSAQPAPAAIDDPEKRAEAAAAELAAEKRTVACLEEVVRLQPRHARAHIQLAKSYLRLFDLLQIEAPNPMSLRDIRDAAIKSQAGFPSRKARDAWMRRAFGEHCEHLNRALYHTRRGLALCPLQGKGYLYLAELCFLDGLPASSKRDYLNQALAVRPFDGYVLYAAANEAWLAGDPKLWLDYSKRSFHSGRMIRAQIIRDLVGNTEPDGLENMIAFILEQYRPNLWGLRLLHKMCMKHGRPDQLDSLRRHYAQALESHAETLSGSQAADVWLEAEKLYSQLDDWQKALQCAQRAFACCPNQCRVRYRLALRLIDQGLLAEAESHLQWCVQRRPGHRGMEKKYRDVLRRRLDLEGMPLSRNP
jgi:O-antigen ligase/tetratricopeptide (TPR) repeat protein